MSIATGLSTYMLDESARNINRLEPETGASAGLGPATTLEAHLDMVERKLGDLQTQVQKLQRLASLGTVSAILAHEFNNLLTPILSYCQYALSKNDPEMLRTAVEKTLKNARRLSGLSGSVLGMAVDDQMGPVDTEIGPILQEAVDCIGRDFEKDNIEVTIESADGLKAHVHAGSLQQVLFNLVLNARQAMSDRSGRLSIVADQLSDGRVRIRVSDTGCGIKPQNLERIFEPFFSSRLHESTVNRRGIGLGLHICRQLMEEQAGSITVESEPGKGSIFILTMPAVHNI